MPKANAWTPDEIEILRTIYAKRGLIAAIEALPGRIGGSISQKASKLGIKCEVQGFPKGSYRHFSEQAWLLRHEEKLSYASIGEVLGCCEANATNAVLYADCIRAGHTPIQRHAGGKLKLEGRERLRAMFRKGWTHRKIQEWTGCPAATLTCERKMYAAELKAAGMAPLPAIGGGLRYSGARIPKDIARKVEQLYLEGFGTKTITRMTGVSNTHSLRTRDRLIKRLKRKGLELPGCDAKGVRRIFKNHCAHVPQILLDEFARLIMAGTMTVAWAADTAGIGRPTGYEIYEQLKAEADARGDPLPRFEWRHLPKGRPKPARLNGKPQFIRYYALIRQGFSIEEGKRLVLEEERQLIIDERARRIVERARPKSLEEQLALLASGKGTLYFERPMLAVEPIFTLGGVSANL